MFANTKGWRRIIPWLVVGKIVYLAAVCLAVRFWPDFDEEKSNEINARWFDSASGRSPPEVPTGIRRHFATWDAEHYLFLSEAGYSEGEKSCAFYPLWPLVIRWFSVLTGGSHLIGGMVLANLFSLAAWTIFYHVAARRFGETVAFWALVFLIVFPGSLFYQFIYSESLFFLLLMLLWLGLERNRYGLAWIAAFLLPLTRGVGVFSVLPIGWQWLMRRRWRWLEKWQWLDAERQRLRSGDSVDVRWPAYTIMAAPPLGLTLYFALLWVWTGNPFEGFEAQKFWGVHSIGNLWNLPKFIIGFFEPTTWHGFRGSVLDRCAFMLLIYCFPLI